MIDKIMAELEELLNSDVSSYRLGKETGVRSQVIQRYRNGETKLENMTLKTARKLLKLQVKEVQIREKR